MATQPTNYFVDPLSGSDGSGDGSLGNPWQTIQFALDNITQDTTNGDQINIRDSADAVLSADLDTSTYGTPSVLAPLVFRGYTSVAYDGGIGTIDGNGGDIMVNANNTIHIDMRFHNYGDFVSAAGGLAMLGIKYFNCTFEDAINAVEIYQDGYLAGCYFNNVTNAINASGPSVEQPIFVYGCFFENIGSIGIGCYRAVPYLFNNIISLSNSANYGVRFSSLSTESMAVVANNTIYGGGSGGEGLSYRNIQNSNIMIVNNIVTDFSGIGGYGVRTLTSDNQRTVYGYNAFYNNTIDESVSAGSIILDLGNNQYLSIDPFTDSANGDFSLADDTLAALSWPNTFRGSGISQFLDLGAVQLQSASGSGRIPRIRKHGS